MGVHKISGTLYSLLYCVYGNVITILKSLEDQTDIVQFLVCPKK